MKMNKKEFMEKLNDPEFIKSISPDMLEHLKKHFLNCNNNEGIDVSPEAMQGFPAQII